MGILLCDIISRFMQPHQMSHSTGLTYYADHSLDYSTVQIILPDYSTVQDIHSQKATQPTSLIHANAHPPQ